jgi:uroporphyrin-III C-methyltransferase
MSSVSIFIVGSGPGPVDLLTLRAAKTIARADVLIHDALVSAEVLALATKAQRIEVGKRHSKQSAKQSDINTLLVQEGIAAQSTGRVVVRLKGGDPLIFARAEEELDALAAAGLDFEVVSGITSAQAAHASIKAPMTRRGSQRNFVLATPQVQSGDLIGTAWARPVVAAGAGAIYMAASAASRIKGCLLALGMPSDTLVTWVSDAGHVNAQSHPQTLQTLEAPQASASNCLTNAQAPVILLIGVHPHQFTLTQKKRLSQWTQAQSLTSLASSAPVLLSV